MRGERRKDIDLTTFMSFYGRKETTSQKIEDRLTVGNIFGGTVILEVKS